MIMRIFLLFCLIAISHTRSLLGNDAHVTKAPTPAWVKPCAFSLEPIEPKPSQEHLQHLLFDFQRNWEEKTTYNHFVTKALTQSGVEKISQLKIDFEPSFRKVVLHAIRVFRDGEFFDRMETSRHHVIQEETGLDHGIYNGDFTLVYFLDDIRVGDIVEYEVSFIGHHPLFTSHLTGEVLLQYESSIEKLHYRLLSRSDHAFQIQPLHTKIEPKIQDLSSNLREWVWEISETEPYPYESRLPAWYFPKARLVFSQYQNWQEVAEKLIPFYKLPADLEHTCPEEMIELVSAWESSSNNPREKALFALRFVQDEVRYQGLEEGAGGFKPRDPREVFTSRYGDCKDKTHLLQTLLHMMNISSTPMLVHTRSGKLLPELIPSPFLFNHAVLQIEIDGAVFWVDATFSLQGGSLEQNYFPNFASGLLLSKNSSKLVEIPTPKCHKPIEIDTSFVVKSANSAELTIKRTFHGFNADSMRGYLQDEGEKEFSKDMLDDIQKTYGGAKVIVPLKIQDDREKNTLVITASYTIPTRSKAKNKTLRFFSTTIENYLQSWVNPERHSPYALSFPLWVKEQVHIENPFISWESSSDEKNYQNDSLLFAHTTNVQSHSADFTFELRHLQDHVPQSELHNYWDMCQEIHDTAHKELTISSLKHLLKTL